MKHRLLLIVSLLAALFPAVSPLQAQIIIHPHTVQALLDCGASRFYTADDKDAPPILAGSLADAGRPVVFRTCRDADGNTHYYFRAAYPNTDGVCRIRDQEIFPGSRGDAYPVPLGTNNSVTIRGWKAWPPDDWTLLHYTRQSSVLGFVSNTDCPPGNDARYIALTDVTDGMLKSFQAAWEGVTVSPEALARAFSDVPTASSFDAKTDATPSQRLRDRLRDSVFTDHEHMNYIQCRAEGCAAGFESIVVDFDTGPNGIIFTRLRPVWVY